MSSRVHFLAPELAKWDAASVDALALGFFHDERPLRGAAGIADWRLGGRLTRLIKAGRIGGKKGEVLLLPPTRKRLTFPRIFLFGLGPSESYDEARFRDDIRRMRAVLHKAGFLRYALQPPGRATGLIAARRALELWLDQGKKDGLEAEVTLIESTSGQKEMAEALRASRGSGSKE
jgi:hypothetical protein